MNISLRDALAGADVVVQTIHGNVIMTLPIGLQPGAIRMLKGKGIFDSTSRKQGDHYVVIDVSLPKYYFSYNYIDYLQKTL